MKKKLTILLFLTMFVFTIVGFGSLHTIAKANALPGGLGLLPSWADKAKVPRVSLRDVNALSLPASVDLSNLLPPVGDQGQQGSCVAWAVGYYYKTFTEHKDENWDVTTNAHQFSPAFIYNQINGGHDNGSSFNSAFQLLEDKGCDTLKIFPYNDQDYTTQPTQDQLNLAIPFKIKSYANIFYGRYVNSSAGAPTTDWQWSGTALTDQDISNLKDILANGSIFVIGIPVFSTWYHAGFGANDYIHQVPADGEVTFYGYHAVTLVGYDDTVHGGAFRMVNSWGTGWGDNGFTWITYDWVKQCAEEGWVMTELSPDFTVQVSTPNGGESFNSGDSCQIQWSSADAGGGNAEFAKYANVYYVQNSVSHTIASHVNNTGSYTWTIPDNLQGDVKIKVEITDDTYFVLANDDSDSTFTVNGSSSSPSITLTQPNGGETLTAGSTYTIQWTSSNLSSGRIRILFFDGSHWSFVAKNLPLTQTSYDWTVPSVNSSNCKIRVGTYDPSNNAWLLHDDSDSTFTVNGSSSSPSITLTQPNGGETLTAGSTYTIQWTSSNLSSGRIRILFFDGSHWSFVAKNLPLTQTSYDWTVPSVNSSNCKIRVGTYDPSNNAWLLHDDSDSTFTVTSP